MLVNLCTVHTAPKGGGRKSKFQNAVFGLISSYLMLAIMFEPKNVDTRTVRAENLIMSRGGFLLDFYKTENLPCKMPFFTNFDYKYCMI